MLRKLSHLVSKISLAIVLLSFMGCNPSSKPSQTTGVPTTDLSLNLGDNATEVDSATVIAEWKGLIALTNPVPTQTLPFALTLSKEDTSWLLKIIPELTADHRQNLQVLLDSVLKHPSSLPANRDVRLIIKERDTELLKLLQLKSDSSFVFKPLPETAYWTYQHREIPGYAGLNQSYVRTFLTYKLASPIPSLQYTLGFKNQGGEKDAIQDAASSMLETLGSSSAAYEIATGNPSADSCWKDLIENHRLLIDSNQMTLNWATIDFNFRPFSPVLDQDTVVKSSIAKLPSIDPKVYHVLIAPTISHVLHAYRFINAG